MISLIVMISIYAIFHFFFNLSLFLPKFSYCVSVFYVEVIDLCMFVYHLNFLFFWILSIQSCFVFKSIMKCVEVCIIS